MAAIKASVEAKALQSRDSESQQDVSEKSGTVNDQKDMLRMGRNSSCAESLVVCRFLVTL